MSSTSVDLIRPEKDGIHQQLADLQPDMCFKFCSEITGLKPVIICALL